MKIISLSAILFFSFALFSQNDSSKKTEIYDQLDKNYVPSKITPNTIAKPLDYDKEIKRLENLLLAEQTKSAPDASHISKLTFHIQDLKIKRQNHNLK
jgi:hypothetical protein